MEERKKQLTEHERQQVLTLRNKGMVFHKISETLGIPLSTCSYVVWMAEHDHPPEKRSKKKRFLENPHGSFVASLLDEDAGLTLGQLVEKCRERFGVVFSHSTISHSITNFHYSFKRTRLRSERSEVPELLQDRVEYATLFHQVFCSNESFFFFLDEVGFSVCMRQPYGYAPQGIPPVVTAPAIHSRNFNVIALIGMPQGNPLEKVMITKVLPSAANAELCHSFLVEVLENLGSCGINTGAIVLDNVPFHHSKTVTDLFPPGGPFILMFLPPYSPFFNPIENIFGTWKSLVCSAKPRNEGELMCTLASTSMQITAETIMNTIYHTDTICEDFAKGNYHAF